MGDMADLVNDDSPNEWWMSSERITCWVKTEGHRIVAAAPILRGFIGQPMSNLEAWMRCQGGFRKERIYGTRGTAI